MERVLPGFDPDGLDVVVGGRFAHRTPRSRGEILHRPVTGP